MNPDISRFLNENGKVNKLPNKQIVKLVVLQYLATKFDCKIIYSEKEINQIIDAWHTFGDYFLLRRELVDNLLISRTKDGSKYWVQEKQQQKAPDPGLKI